MIINQDGRVHEAPNLRAASHWTTDIRKPPEKFDMIEQIVAEASSGGRKINRGIFQNFFEVC